MAFADAVKNKNVDAVAEFTGGESSYYDFLSHINITDYTLYPFTFSQQVIDEMMANWRYPVASAHYFAEFNVVSSEHEDFPLGKAVFYMGFSDASVMGNKLSLFVPVGDAEKFMFVTSNENAADDYIEYFVREFVSEYCHKLADGRNYPDSFTFNDSVHFITHLMANCGEYAAFPPYTMEEISDFVTRTFDGNDGVDSTELDYMVWLNDIVLDEIPVDDRMFGCSLSHGLAIAEHKIVDIKTDGNSKIYTVEMYADFSHFAPASTVVFYFDVNEGELPKLTMVDLRDNMAREAAVVAV